MEKGSVTWVECVNFRIAHKRPSLLGSLESLAKHMINLKFLHYPAYVSALKEDFIHRNAYLSGPLSQREASGCLLN